MTISYHRYDESPPWLATVRLNGELPDLSAGYTFKVRIAPEDDSAEFEVEKTAGIFGYTEGRVIVDWATDELDLDPGTYKINLIGKHVTDNDKEFTIWDDLIIRPRIGPPPA